MPHATHSRLISLYPGHLLSITTAPFFGADAYSATDDKENERPEGQDSENPREEVEEGERREKEARDYVGCKCRGCGGGNVYVFFR